MFHLLPQKSLGDRDANRGFRTTFSVMMPVVKLKSSDTPRVLKESDTLTKRAAIKLLTK